MFTYYAKIKGAILCMYVHVNFCFQGGVISSKPNNMVSTDRPKLIKICCSCGQHRHVSVVVERDFQPLEVKDTNKGILRQKAEQREMGLWACLAVISPFPFYYYLWTHPQKWVDLCGSGRDPCKVMAIVSHFLKLIQFISLLSVSTFSWPPPLYFWPLFIFGQFLNFRVYQLLGEAGTYYGVRFGKNIPWATEFPFGVIRDPQYVGSILSLLACLSWVPFLYIFLWVLGYAFIIQVESKEDPATRAKPLS